MTAERIMDRAGLENGKPIDLCKVKARDKGKLEENREPTRVEPGDSGRRAATAWHLPIGAEPCAVSRNPDMKTPNR